MVWFGTRQSIFHGPLVSALKSRSNCKGYLIIRDIFPEWAVDMGLMGRGPPYRFFDAVAQYQYSVADVIGVQTPGNSGTLRSMVTTAGAHAGKYSRTGWASPLRLAVPSGVNSKRRPVASV